MWNQIALDVTAIDHAPPSPGVSAESRLQQPGPHRSSRAMAVVHIAIFEAINEGSRFNEPDPGKRRFRFASYTKRTPTVTTPVSIDAAISTAAHRTLARLYKGQVTELDDLLAKDMARIVGGASPIPTPVVEGQALGIAAADAILDIRATDRSNHDEPTVGDPGFPLNTTPGRWTPDPVSGLTVALGGRWNEVVPFSIPKAESFRSPPPPSLNDPIYTRDYLDVRRLGGDGVRTPTDRRDFETFKGVFWAYDGTAFLCAPPRLYNQIIRTVAFNYLDRKNDGIRRRNQSEGSSQKIQQLAVLDYARLFALQNMTMADAALSAWEAKYHYQYWRPVTGIRAGAADGNPFTEGDALWYPRAAPASNSARMPNFTPPFPAYPSGHAVFGGAIFEMLRKFIPDQTPFVFTSDEYNGRNREFNDPIPRPYLPQSFVSLSHPEYENARSRIYLGVHWQFDADAGIAQGHQVASHVFGNAFQCLDELGNQQSCPLQMGLGTEDKP